MRRHCVFFNDTATTEIYTLSLHDSLPIWAGRLACRDGVERAGLHPGHLGDDRQAETGDSHSRRLSGPRSEEHTSELQSRQYLVCRLLLEKKNNKPCSVNTNLNDLIHTTQK